MAKSAILQFEDCKTTRSRRTGTIPGNVVEALKTHGKVVIAERQLRGARWQDHDLIFPSGAGTPPDMRSLVRLHFDAYRKAAKLDKCSPYVLRHSHNSGLLAQGLPVAEVSARVSRAHDPRRRADDSEWCVPLRAATAAGVVQSRSARLSQRPAHHLTRRQPDFGRRMNLPGVNGRSGGRGGRIESSSPSRARGTPSRSQCHASSWNQSG